MALGSLASAPVALAAPVTFNTPGTESQYVLPNQNGTLQVMAIGAAGGQGASVGTNTGGTPGRGGIINVTLVVGPGGIGPGTPLYVEVGGVGSSGGVGGGGGSNGGGNAGPVGGAKGGGGGGSSDIRTCSNTVPGVTCPGNVASTETRLVVASGGGGGAGAGVLSGVAGTNANGGNGGNGNAGPGPVGGGGTDGQPPVVSGLPSGGTSGGGATALNPAGGGSIGANGALACGGNTSGASGDRLGDPTVTTVLHGGNGGNGSSGTGCQPAGTGGGGGSGYEGGGGGGGGGSGTTSSGGGGGGGAGSSYPDVGGATYGTDTTGIGAEVVLTFTPAAPPPSPTPTPSVVPTATPAATAAPGGNSGTTSGGGTSSTSSTPFTGGPAVPAGGFVLVAVAGLLLAGSGATLAVRSRRRRPG